MATYGVSSEAYVSTHGLFSAHTNSCKLNSPLAKVQTDLGNVATDVDYIAQFGEQFVTEISAVEGKGSVIIDYDLTQASGLQRDKPLFYGYYLIFKDLILKRNSGVNSVSYMVSLNRAPSEGIMASNCDILLTGRYTLNYHNGCNYLGWRLFKDVLFQEEPANNSYPTQLYRNYSCSQIFLNTTFKHPDGTEFVYPY
jgi:hypothetical protein